MVVERIASTPGELRALWPDLRDAVVIGLDLRQERFGWSAADVEGCTFFGCLFQHGDWNLLATSGATIFSVPGGLPFEPYRATLYDYEELTARAPGDAVGTVDDRMASWFAASSSTSVSDLAIRAVHDATIDAAIARFVVDRRVVGVMGGHATPRGGDLYRQVAQLGRDLTRDGFCVATGGGPGVMEAANLGAWFSTFADDDLDAAIAILADAPTYADDPEAYAERTIEVRRRWPAGGESLGVPTWVYADEPTAGFASHIGKYFTNSVRENGLLAIARSGVVYTPGGAGTEQEIFTDTAQNSLTLYEVRSPMVFFDRGHYEGERADLLSAARDQASAFGWDDLVAVCDEPAEIVAFIARHDPDHEGGRGVQRRRTHRDRPR
jgi:predicted Rossmann-fold nucleotide-binding protein